jgi:hypothetical protein
MALQQILSDVSDWLTGVREYSAWEGGAPFDENQLDVDHQNLSSRT